MGQCKLGCEDFFPDEELLEHMRLFHPDQYAGEELEVIDSTGSEDD